MEFDKLSLVLLLPGGTANTDNLQNAHMAFLRARQDDGVLKAAGPVFGPEGRAFNGVALYALPVAEAMGIAAEDPAVVAGVFTLEAHEWWVPAGTVSFGSGTLPRSVAEVHGS